MARPSASRTRSSTGVTGSLNRSFTCGGACGSTAPSPGVASSSSACASAGGTGRSDIRKTMRAASRVLNELRRRPSVERPVEKPGGVAPHDLVALFGREVEAIDGLDGGPDRAERRVGSEHHVIRAEEVEAAAQAVFATEQGGVAVELVEIVEVRALEPRQHA